MHCHSSTIIRQRNKTAIVTVMLDSIHLLLTSRETGHEFCLNEMGKRLQDEGKLIKHSTGFVFGHLENLRIAVSPFSMSIKGSLPKFMFGNNVEALNRSATIEASERLSDLLHLPIGAGRLTRVDLSSLFIVNHSPVSYFARLQSCPRYYRASDGSTLYYIQKANLMTFYDKQNEASGQLPAVYKGRNLLKYEFRLKKNPSQQLKTELTLNSITDEETYMKAVDLWADKYFSINKSTGIIGIDPMKINKPSDLKEYLAAMQAQSLGAEKLQQLIQEVKANKNFKHNKQLSRLKKEADDLLNLSCNDAGFELTEELDKCVFRRY